MLTEAERTTRKKRIGPRLIRAGWSVAPYRPNGAYVRTFSDYDFGIEVAKRVANKNDVNQKTSATASPGALAKPPATACGGLRPNLKTWSWSQ